VFLFGGLVVTALLDFRCSCDFPFRHPRASEDPVGCA